MKLTRQYMASIAFSLFLLMTFTQCSGWTQVVREEKDAALLVKEAWLSAKANLHSGHGFGYYEVYWQEEGQQQFYLKVKARVETAFSNTKYYIKLDYENGKSGTIPCSSRIIIFDGTTIATSYFWPKISPRGAAGDLFSSDHTSKPLLAQFAFDPRNLPAAFLDFETLSNNKIELSYAKSKGGEFIGQYRRGKAVGEFDAPPRSGFNVTALRTHNEGNPMLVQDCRAEWALADGVWYVKKISDQFNALAGYKHREVLNYDSYQVNPEVSPVLFHLSSLQLPAGARILDHRSKDGSQEQYWIPPSGIPVTDSLDSLVDEAKRLSTNDFPRPRSRTLTWLLLVVGGILATLALIRLWLRGRSHNSSHPNST